jgi:hypothetical protein
MTFVPLSEYPQHKRESWAKPDTVVCSTEEKDIVITRSSGLQLHHRKSKMDVESDYSG